MSFSVFKTSTLALSLFFLSVASQAVTIPAGAKLDIRLTTPVGSDKGDGQQVKAALIAPVLINGVSALRIGTLFIGKTKDVFVSKDADVASKMYLVFDKIETSPGKTKSISTQLDLVDNSREAVDNTGKIIGITAAQTWTSRMDSGIQKLSEKYPSLGGLLGQFKGAVLKDADATIRFDPGVEMTVTLTKAFDWTGPADTRHIDAITPEDELAGLINAQPFQTTAENPPKPSDITNLAFIGSEEELRNAFKDAGWTTADALGSTSNIEVFRAMVEGRGYKEAPMSILLLENRPPDLVFQKALNTFAMRHHLRIWKRPETFQGKPLWVCAATHDISIIFSQESKTFTHGIDSNIDKERLKVVNDLLYTGRVQALALVDRDQVPKESQNATGDSLITDAKMAVLLLRPQAAK